MKFKLTAIVLAIILALSMFAGCGGTDSANDGDFDSDKEINLVTREDGSGTRSAFVELLEIEVKNDDGTKQDLTSVEAVVAKATDIMMTSISGDTYSIGYISLGSMNETVKAVKIDEVEATAENVKNGSYAIQRPFNIVTKGDVDGLAKDFIDFILSADGQKVIAEGYVSIDDSAADFESASPSGKITVGGSTSVSPIMEKLKEAYLAINPDAEIEIQTTDSSAGITGTIDGILDIGMASRDLKDEEVGEVDSTQIAIDGLAVIVNNSNPIESLTADQIKSMYIGDTTSWSEVE